MNISEIIPHLLPNEPKLSKKKFNKTGKASFSQVLKSQESHLEERNSVGVDLSLQELEVILGEVHVLGETLVVEPSFVNVKRYKEKIAQFLECVVKGAVDLKSDKGQVRHDFKRSKYTIVCIVNQKLDRLAGSVLQNQALQLKLLESIGEIQGLLVDLIR